MDRKQTFYEKYVKRFLDVLLSLGGLILLSPLMLLVALLVGIKLGFPVIFCQERPGKDERIFKLYKFRTMTNEKDDRGELLPDEKRLTAFGKFLRASSLDELPELWNILKGDMSIVGPRPLLVSYLPYYTDEEKRRHSVSPGLTGLAQVNGRNCLSWEKKFAYDLEYINDLSFITDVKIIIKTILKVFIRADIQTDTQKTEGNLAKIRQTSQMENSKK
jgi:lipopolysaccharide/colanic/teichoic acid biosynthesis glycosyltransferase